MKENITWLALWCKRLIRKPLLLFTILLMPLTTLFLQQCSTKQDAVLRVTLCLEPGSAEVSDNGNLLTGNGEELVKHMTSLSDAMELKGYSILIIRCLFRYCVKRKGNYFVKYRQTSLKLMQQFQNQKTSMPRNV